MRAHNKTMSYVGVVALAIGAAAPTVAQQTGLSCVAEIAQARAKIAEALAGGLPTPADPGGQGSGVGREMAAASGTGSSGRSGRIQEAQAMVGAAESACDAGDTAKAVAKARQAVNILQ